MITIVAGMSRSGSMWTYAVTRAIYRTKDYQVWPDPVTPFGPSDVKLALKSPVVNGEVRCLKTHFPLKFPVPTEHEVKVISNIRDVREACLSFMRFLNLDFETGIRAVEDMIKVSDYYLDTFRGELLCIRYEEIAANPADVIRRISRYLDVPLTDMQVTRIQETYSKEAVQEKLQFMSRLEVGPDGALANDKMKSQFRTVRYNGGLPRIFDKSSGFQTNHISVRPSAEWRTYFNDEQVKRLNSVSSAWLLKHGYGI